MKKYIVTFLLAAIPACILAGGVSGVPVLDMYSGAKPASLAGVSAASGGIDSVWDNPAGMLEMKKAAVNFTYFQDAADMTNMFVNAAVPFGTAGTMEVSAAYSGAGMVDNALEEGGVEARDMAAALGYAYSFSHEVRAGIAVKYVNSKLGPYAASSVSGSFGAMYMAGDSLAIGADIKNVGPGLTYDKSATALPMKAGLGAHFTAINSGDHRVNCGADLGYAVADRLISAGISAEYTYMGALSLRAGYMYQDKNTAGLGFGAGIKTAMKWGELGIDYAYAPESFGTENNVARNILTVTVGF